MLTDYARLAFSADECDAVFDSLHRPQVKGPISNPSTGQIATFDTS